MIRARNTREIGVRDSARDEQSRCVYVPSLFIMSGLKFPRCVAIFFSIYYWLVNILPAIAVKVTKTNIHSTAIC